MNSSTVAALAAVLTLLVSALALLTAKTINSWRRRFEATSRASYIAVFGELTSRGSYPNEILAAWTDDPVFREALVDFMRLLDGAERDRLLQVARDLGIVEAAVTVLRTSRRRQKRVKAALMLSELADPQTSDALLDALDDREAGVRVNASAALAKLGEPDLVDAILATLDRESEWDAARTMDQLTSLGSASVDGLIGYLGDLNEQMPKFGRLAMQSLGAIGDFKAEPTLLLALSNTDPGIRVVAAGALQAAGTERCVPALIQAVSDHDGGVRARAAKSLGSHFDTRALKPLFKGLHDREWRVRKNSAESLARLPDGVDSLQMALRANDHFARDAAREQLMLLGIPAGLDDDEQSDTASDAGWIEDQMRALGGGEGVPVDARASEVTVQIQTPIDYDVPADPWSDHRA